MALSLLLLGLWTPAVLADPPACRLRLQTEDDGVMQTSWVSVFLAKKDGINSELLKKNGVYESILFFFFFLLQMLQGNVISVGCVEDLSKYNCL